MELYTMYQLKEPKPLAQEMVLDYNEILATVKEEITRYPKILQNTRTTALWTGHNTVYTTSDYVNLVANFFEKIHYTPPTFKVGEGKVILTPRLGSTHNQPWYFGPCHCLKSYGSYFLSCVTKQTLLKYTVYPELIEKFKDLPDEEALYVLNTTACAMTPGDPSINRNRYGNHTNHQYSLVEHPFTVSQFLAAYGIANDSDSRKIVIQPKASALFE